MAFLPAPSSDHQQYFFQSYHHQLDHEDPPPTALNILSCPLQDFHGGHVASLTMMKHHQQQRSPVFSGCGAGGYNNEHQGHGGTGDDHDDLSDDGSQLVLGEKKKRLNLEQVKILEKNFELGKKLEPERKIQLAKALGLQPRQVAIWFQNKRARWKTKQLEKEYNILKRQFEALKADNDSLLAHNKKLQAQLLALKSGATNAVTTTKEKGEFGSINLNATTKSYCWSNNGSEISSADINLGVSTTPPSQPDQESPPSNKLQFPAPFLPTSLTDLLTSSSSTPKKIQDDSFCSLFGGGAGGGVSNGGGVGEQQPFWAWAPDQHHLL